MRKRLIVMLALAVLLVASVYLVADYLQYRATPQAAASTGTMPVVVAARDIPAGVRLAPAMMKTLAWPENALPQGYFPDVAAVVEPLPPVALQPIRRGEIVLAYKLTGQSARGSFIGHIPEHMRAMSIPVAQGGGLAGAVSPGSFVDVLLTSAAGRRDRLPSTQVLLQNVPVLGVEQYSADNKADPKMVKSVTLLVDPESGQKLALALATGTLSLLLRNDFDASLLATREVTWRDLGGASAAPAAPRVVKRERRGGQVMAVPAGSLPLSPDMLRPLNATRQHVAEPATNVDRNIP